MHEQDNNDEEVGFEDDEMTFDESISRLKVRKRGELSNVRKQYRDKAYAQRRLHLSEAEAAVTNIPLSQFKELVIKLTNLKAKQSLQVLKILKNNCSSLPYIETFFRTPGAFESLSKILNCQNGQLQLESAACITNLACGTHKASRRIARASGAYLISFMSGCSPYLQSQCTWAVGNIAHDCWECLSILKSLGISTALEHVLESSISEVTQSAVFALHACTKYEDIHFKNLAVPTIRLLLLKLLKEKKFPSKRDAALSLVNIYCLCVKNNIEVYLKEVLQILELLCDLTKDEKNVDTSIALPLMHCLGFLSSCEGLCKQLYLQRSFHDLALRALNHRTLRKGVIWVLTNIATIHCEDKLESFIVHKTMEHLQNPAEALTNEELYLICVLVTKSENMKLKLQQGNVISKVNFLIQIGDRSTESACKYFVKLMNAEL